MAALVLRPPGPMIKPLESHAGTTTSWLPMVTPPPIDPRCPSQLCSAGKPHPILFAFDPHLETLANMTCLPPEVVEWRSQKRPYYGTTSAGDTVTSLGPMVCPHAYMTAATSRKDESSTMVFCCPSNYTFATSTGPGSQMDGCTSQQTGPLTVHYPARDARPSVQTLPPNSSSRPRTVDGVAVSGWIFAPPTPIVLTPVSLSPTSISSPTISVSDTAWAKKHLSLSNGTLLGVAFGIVSGFSVILLTILFLTKRSKRLGAKPNVAHEHDGEANGTSALAHVVNDDGNMHMSDLGPDGRRVTSTAGTVVRHTGSIPSIKSEESGRRRDEVENQRSA